METLSVATSRAEQPPSASGLILGACGDDEIADALQHHPPTWQCCKGTSWQEPFWPLYSFHIKCGHSGISLS